MLRRHLVLPPLLAFAPLAIAQECQVDDFFRGSFAIGGLEQPLYLAGDGRVDIRGSHLTMSHPSGMTPLNECVRDWSKADALTQMKLLGRTVTFTIDLSKVGCACNVAFYLTSTPGRFLNGTINPGAADSGQPKFYCDANQIGGQWCPEVDIMEANNHAFQTTLHKCSANGTKGHYDACDRRGCTEKAHMIENGYGPGATFKINSLQPFEVRTEFPEEDGVLVGFRQVLRQANRELVLEHDDCSPSYLAEMSAALAAGMSLRISYWGASADMMAWMDSPPCSNTTTCSGDNALEAVLSNVQVGVAPKRPKLDLDSLNIINFQARKTKAPPRVWEPPTPSTTPKLLGGFETLTMSIRGVSDSVAMVGGGMVVEDDKLVLSHNSGMTAFNSFEGDWLPEQMLQLQVLGRMLSFTADLSKVGCGCNMGLRLAGGPPRGWDGQFIRGDNRGGQPPYYCDANKVGGQWCPELDLMEANDHVFQVNTHKCDNPARGVFTSCDYTGCAVTTKDRPGAYGPGPTNTINTQKPFQVYVEFKEEGAQLVAIRTTLVQGTNQVVLESTCDRYYLSQVTNVLRDGMSLRLSYWGEEAAAMTWLDGGVCGAQACADTAGPAAISDLAVQSLPTGPLNQAPAAAQDPSMVWVVNDPKDSLHGKVVPQEVIARGASEVFVKLGGRGIVEWQGGTHFVEHIDKARLNSLSEMNWNELHIAKKYDASTRQIDKKVGQGPSQLISGAGPRAVAVVLCVSMVLLVAAGVRRGRRCDTASVTKHPGRSESPEPAAAAEPDTGRAAAVAVPKAEAGPGQSGSLRRTCSSNSVALLPRSGGSTQQLLSMWEGNIGD